MTKEGWLHGSWGVHWTRVAGESWANGREWFMASRMHEPRLTAEDELRAMTLPDVDWDRVVDDSQRNAGRGHDALL